MQGEEKNIQTIAERIFSLLREIIQELHNNQHDSFLLKCQPASQIRHYQNAMRQKDHKINKKLCGVTDQLFELLSVYGEERQLLLQKAVENRESMREEIQHSGVLQEPEEKRGSLERNVSLERREVSLERREETEQKIMEGRQLDIMALKRNELADRVWWENFRMLQKARESLLPGNKEKHSFPNSSRSQEYFRIENVSLQKDNLRDRND